MAIQIPVTFIGGSAGQWQVISQAAVCGPALPAVSHLAVYEGERALETPANAVWTLRGITSYERYVLASEHALLVAPATAGPSPGDAGSAHPHQEIGGLVGLVPG